MSRAHFILIADVLKHLRTFEAYDKELSEVVKHSVRKTDVVNDFARALRSTNPQFKWERFVDACDES
jgi:hypothetical protein